MTYNIQEHQDFARYYDTALKRNYWVLGYFGGGSVNIENAYSVALDFGMANHVPLQSIHIDEVPYSRRYKGFKYLYSSESEQLPETGSYHMENVFQFLTN